MTAVWAHFTAWNIHLAHKRFRRLQYLPKKNVGRFFAHREVMV